MPTSAATLASSSRGERTSRVNPVASAISSVIGARRHGVVEVERRGRRSVSLVVPSTSMARPATSSSKTTMVSV